MDRPLKRIWGVDVDPISAVSILVLVDRPLKLLRCASRCRRAFSMFQSLFWWIGLSNPPEPPLPGYYDDSFNPCSGGSASQTPPNRGRRIARLRFNPCSGGSASQTPIIDALAGFDMCFNPCSGGSASQTGAKYSLVLRRFGFNPCSGGSASQTIHNRRRAEFHIVSILVLVDRPLKHRALKF